MNGILEEVSGPKREGRTGFHFSVSDLKFSSRDQTWIKSGPRVSAGTNPCSSAICDTFNNHI